MSLAETQYKHIILDEAKVPVIAGTTLKVLGWRGKRSGQIDGLPNQRMVCPESRRLLTGPARPPALAQAKLTSGADAQRISRISILLGALILSRGTSKI
jgi:hypothetical protein